MHPMKTERRNPVRLVAVLLATGLLMLAGCEAVFTFSPFTALQRKPADLTPEQRVTYAQDALASGDPAAMQTALEAIKDDTSIAAVYISAQLEIELSGLPTLMASAVGNMDDPEAIAGGAASVDEFLSAHPDLKPEMIIDAGRRLENLGTDVTLKSSDLVIGAIGLALEASAGTTPPYNFADPSVNLADAITFLTSQPPEPGSVAQTLADYLANP
jgi:hypothetical protein